MTDSAAVEIKAFVPAKDFGLSKKFYTDLGFDLKWTDEELAYFACGATSFLLQNFYVKAHADNFMMHLLVRNADDWWNRLTASGIVDRYGVSMTEPGDRSWGMRDFTLIDPSGVLWHIANNIPQS
ncbi:MAG: VOC family protein [Gammaproteobacteria bacterium]|nr:VOC family protein [Gammaproteobacteria bacterium]